MNNIGINYNNKLYCCKIKNNISNNIDILIDIIDHIDDEFEFFKKGLKKIKPIKEDRIQEFYDYWIDFSSIIETGYFIDDKDNNMYHMIDIDNKKFLYEKKEYVLNKETLISLMNKKFFETLLK
jgi:hypothetical protein